MILVPVDDNGCSFGNYCRRWAGDDIIKIEVDKKNINNYFNLWVATIIFHLKPRPTPWTGRPCIRSYGSITSMPP
jgi:hypothetical protein